MNEIIDDEIVAVRVTSIVGKPSVTLCQQMLLLNRQFLNPKRQRQVLKAGLGEAAKRYLEDILISFFTYDRPQWLALVDPRKKIFKNK